MTDSLEERLADKIAREMTEAQIEMFEEEYGELETKEGQSKFERIREIVESVEVEDNDLDMDRARRQAIEMRERTHEQKEEER